MSEKILTDMISWALVAVPIVLGTTVLWKLFTRTIDLSGLLQGDRADGETYFSPGRVQLLVVTILVSISMLAHVIANPSSFPPIPKEFLGVLGGSQLLYLGGKARAMLGIGWTSGRA